jgi:hypothetical protein
MGHDLPLNSPLDIIPYYYLDSFNTNYIIFRNVDFFFSNLLQLKEKFEGKY